ncbi:FecR family protein [Pseudomonas sp. PB3P13]
MTDNSLSQAQTDAITDAAAHWCMRLHASDCTAQERLAFDRWFNADPLHALEYAAMLDIWDVAGNLPALAQVAPAVQTKSPTPWRAMGIAAAVCAVALPLAAYSGWSLGLLPTSWQRFEATTAVRQVTLSDGTQVELNLGTTLTFSNYKDERRLTLQKGEAFFNVSHDATHPFVVKAADGSIRVTGTRFNVWMYEDQVRVNLIEGSVLVNSNDDLPGDGVRLAPSMQARYKQGDYTPRISQTDADDSSLAWRNGKLVLDNLPLSEAMPLINRYLSKPVMLADTSTGAIRVGGIYNIKELNSLVGSLPKVLPVYVTRNKHGNPVLNSIPRQPPKS